MRPYATAIAPTSWLHQGPSSRLDEAHQNVIATDESIALPRRVWEQVLLSPVREFLSRPGKELRRNLVEIGWKLAKGGGPVPPELGDAVEIVHGGSLIVDDIEDGAVERRGRPAMHRAYGLPIALNAGNLLYFLPSWLVEKLGLPPKRELQIHRQFATTMLRCHYGQALDVGTHVWDLAPRDAAAAVASATRLKTGSLTAFAMSLGATAAGAGERLRANLERLGCDVGIGLQMLDDLSSIVNLGRLQKGREDVGLGRLTWTWAWAAEQLDEATYVRLRRAARRAASKSRTGAPIVGRASAEVDAILDQLREASSERGRWCVRTHIHATMARARKLFGNGPAIAALETGIASLEKGYGLHA